MTQEEKCAFLICQAAILNAKIAGMCAENQARERRGEAPAYVERHFEEEANASICAWNSAIDYLRR